MLRLTCSLLLLAITFVGTASAEEVHWGYEGETGPAQWAGLSSEFSLCAKGDKQSPIDLTGATQVAGSLGIDLNKLSAPDSLLDRERRSGILDIIDNGHTIQITTDTIIALSIDGMRFELAQFHFHAPSEHAIDGRHYPLEAHFVMSNGRGQLAVLGVLFEAGQYDPEFEPIIDNLPQAPGQERHLRNIAFNIDSLRALPDTYFAYPGSLTTPPCSEGVRWFVIAEPEQLSLAQLGAFTEALHGNARPLQPRNGRELRRTTILTSP